MGEDQLGNTITNYSRTPGIQQWDSSLFHLPVVRIRCSPVGSEAAHLEGLGKALLGWILTGKENLLGG